MLAFPIYLDNNATTPMDERVLEAMAPFFIKHFGNAASRTHAYGWQAAEAVDYSRTQVAQLINAETEEIIFTSGATEACNLAIKGVFERYASKGNHIISVNTEHNAVLDTNKHLAKNGAEISYLQVNSKGLLDLKKLEETITPQTILISVMYANNETGTIQPIKEIGKIANKHGVLFFSDATQAVGKIPVDVMADGIGLMAFSAHKMYGPKGVGALYVRRKNPRAALIAQMDGGGHEKGLRSGTLNVPGIVGFGKACELSKILMKKDTERMKQLRDMLEKALLEHGNIVVNGTTNGRLGHVSNLSFKNTDARDLMAALTKKNIAVSTGSACTSATTEPSHVLMAMGLSKEMAQSAIRFSLGRFTTKEEIDYTISRIKETIQAIDTGSL